MPGLSGHSIFTKHTPPRRADPHFVWKGPGIKLGIKVDNHGHRNSTTQFCCVTARIKNLDPFLIYIYIENHCSQMLLKTIKYPRKAVGFLVVLSERLGGSLNLICCFSQIPPGLNGLFDCGNIQIPGRNGCLIMGIFKYPSTSGYQCIYCRLYNYSIVSDSRIVFCINSEHVRIVNSAVTVTGDRIHRSPLCVYLSLSLEAAVLSAACAHDRSR